MKTPLVPLIGRAFAASFQTNDAPTTAKGWAIAHVTDLAGKWS
jgi:hypothetical protein